MTRDIGIARRSFTLVELLMSIAIVAIVSATSLFTLYGVQEHAKLARTKSSIARIHVVILERYESFLTRPVPVRILPSDSVTTAAGRRLSGLREIMRMHLPDRKSDLLDSSVVLVQPGTGTPLQVSKWLSYRRKADRLVQAAKGVGVDWRDNTLGWTLPHQGSECLYLIFAGIREGDGSALDFFADSEIADTDGDGIPEILDGWGRPIEFLRWAPGFVTLSGNDGGWGRVNVDDDGNGTIDDELEAGFPGTDDRSELQSRVYELGLDLKWGAAGIDEDGNGTIDDASEAGALGTDDVVPARDPFDPRRVDTRKTAAMTPLTFALVPLIYSAGPDGVYDIVSDFPVTHRYSVTSPPNDPYVVHTATNQQMGRPGDADDTNHAGPDGILQCWDNVSNHLVETK